MTPLDDAYQHCVWAKRSGICSRHVILAADGPMGQGKATWLQAVHFLSTAAHGLDRLSGTYPEACPR